MKIRMSQDRTKRLVRTGSRVTVYAQSTGPRVQTVSDTTYPTVRIAKEIMLRG